MARFDERMLNGMGVFAAIVQARSFAAAGDLLNMSQPGVSRAVARLEVLMNRFNSLCFVCMVFID